MNLGSRALSRALSLALEDSKIAMRTMLYHAARELSVFAPFKGNSFVILVRRGKNNWDFGGGEPAAAGILPTLLSTIESLIETGRPYCIIDHSVDGGMTLTSVARTSLLVCTPIAKGEALGSHVAVWIGSKEAAGITEDVLGRSLQVVKEAADWLCDNDLIIRELRSGKRDGDLLKLTRQAISSFAHDCKAPLMALTGGNHDRAYEQEEFRYLADLISSLAERNLHPRAPHVPLRSFLAIIERVVCRCSSQPIHCESISIQEQTESALAYAQCVGVQSEFELAVERVLTNVVCNAVSYGKGEVWVNVARDEQGFVITVDDNGTGFALSLRTAVNNNSAFSVEGSKGWGVGLASAVSTAQRLGGRIILGSAKSGGGSVAIYFPESIFAQRSKRCSASNDLVASTVTTGGRYTLLIDDDKVHMESLQRALGVYGVLAVCASSIEEGHAFILQHSPDTVVCDMRMPDGGATALLSYLKQGSLMARIAVMSGDDSDEAVYELAARGVEAFFAKPINIQELALWCLGPTSTEMQRMHAHSVS